MNKDKRESAGARGKGTMRYALLLFLLSPLVGEFLLGNLPITWLWTLLVLAPMYGGGAILIRETARRLGWGWSSMITLGLAYAVVEEAFVTQSLFNPNYVGLRLLDFGFIPQLGIGAWWTVFVLAIHTVWSAAVPIALTEAISGKRAREVWLGKAGLVVAAVVFLLGCFASAMAPGDEAVFPASKAQLVASGVVVLVLCCVATFWGRRKRARISDEKVPSEAKTGLGSLLIGSGFMSLAIVHSGVPAFVNVAGMLLLLSVWGGCLLRWSGRAGWTARHETAVAIGFLGTYAWYSFVQVPSVGEVSATVDTVGNAALAAGALALAWWSLRRVSA